MLASAIHPADQISAVRGSPVCLVLTLCNPVLPVSPVVNLFRLPSSLRQVNSREWSADNRPFRLEENQLRF